MKTEFFLFLCLAAALSVSCGTDSLPPGRENSSPSVTGSYPKTTIGKLIESALCPVVTEVMWDTTFNVTNGLDYYQMKLSTDEGGKQDIYLLRTNPAMGLDIVVAISSETTESEWCRQLLSEMAANLDSPSKPVYAMINADFCVNDPPIHPRGPVHCNGRVWSSTFDLDPSLNQQGLSYVGVTYDGKMTIAPRDSYPAAQSSLKECTGAGVIMLRGGLVKSGYGDKRDPRTAMGYTSDNIVWMLAVDGRHGTSGMTYGEMASIFKALGCTDAVNLDGGGSTEMLLRDPRSGEISIRNWPSDPTAGEGGQERPRPDAWAIVKNNS